LLTENEIARNWRNLFHRGDLPLDDQTFEKAETLLDGLRAESPLRHRLGAELAELKKQRSAKKPARQTVKK
jgi:hypothetical protein